MKKLTIFLLLFITTTANAQPNICDYVTRSTNRSSIEWHTPDYHNANNTILFAFSKSTSPSGIGTDICLETGCYSDNLPSNTSDVNVKFEDGDELNFADVSLRKDSFNDYGPCKYITSIKLDGAQFYRFKTKKVVSFTVALHYTANLPPTFQTNTIAFANCLENAM